MSADREAVNCEHEMPLEVQCGACVGLLQVEVDELRAELAAVRAERDAPLVGKWAGPWRPSERWKGWNRLLLDGNTHAATAYDDGGFMFAGTFAVECRMAAAGTLDAAKAAADAALVAAGWWLA